MSQHAPSRHDREALDELLRADHAALELTFRRMMTKFAGGDVEAIRAVWVSMEQQLEAHLNAEEEFILPLFETLYPHEAARIRREHVQIRGALLQLGIDLDLHSLREETAAAFIGSLRRHAQSEDNILYSWAQRDLPPVERNRVIERLLVACVHLA